MPSKPGRIGRQQVEDEMRAYFGAITEKPVLYVEVLSLNKPKIELSVESMIVLFFLDSYRLYKLFNVKVLLVPKLRGDPAKEKCVDVVAFNDSDNDCSDGKATVNNDSNVSSNIVIYESDLFFEETTTTTNTTTAPNRKMKTSTIEMMSPSLPTTCTNNAKTCNGNGKEKDAFLEGKGSDVEVDGIGAESTGCKQPSVHLPQKKMHIAGLSAVLRFLLKFACRRQDVCENELGTNVENIDGLLDVERLDKLLGYQRSCLQACAESSIWTRFCEVDMIQMVCTLRSDLQQALLLASETEMTRTSIPVARGAGNTTGNTNSNLLSEELDLEPESDACKSNSINNSKSNLCLVDLDGEMSQELQLQELHIQEQPPSPPPPPLSPRLPDPKPDSVRGGRGELLLEIPKDLLRLEYHLTRPVRIHNFRKRIQNKGSKDKEQPGGNNQDPNHDDHGEIKDERKAPVNRIERNRRGQVQEDDKDHQQQQQQYEHPGQISHDFAEGPDLTLADLLLFPCVGLALVCLGPNIFKKYLPRVDEWHERLCTLLPTRPRVSFEEKLLSQSPWRDVDLEILGKVQVKIPEIPQESLYKSDPSRYKATLRLFTKQDDIETALSFLSSRQIQTLDFNEDRMTAFDWDNFPRLVHPEGGHLPPSRIEKKSHQLSNLAQMVEKVFLDKYERNFNPKVENVTIVDFCSGGGHLGILLAYILPQCEVILVENKEESLRRAETRVKLLGLTNISFYQCNLDYFTGHFEIGVALHACGTATDLVLTKCVEKRASFVCCPCCYGAIQSNHMLHYPRSSTFLQALNTSNGVFSLKHYFVLGHAADQTHDEANEKTSQGKVCMRMIDTDRCFHAQENNYHVALRRMEPSFCSPKNHILVGVPF